MNKRKRGKRAGRSNRERIELERQKDIHSHIRGCKSHNVDHGTSNTALIEDRAARFECAEIDETVETHIVPRRSETIKQLLPFFPQRVELETVHARQLDIKDRDRFTSVEEALQHGKMIETTDERVSWRSDKSLLIKGNPQTSDNIGTFKRQGSIRKGRDKRLTFTTQKELKADGVILGNAAPEGSDDLLSD